MFGALLNLRLSPVTAQLPGVSSSIELEPRLVDQEHLDILILDTK